MGYVSFLELKSRCEGCHCGRNLPYSPNLPNLPYSPNLPPGLLVSLQALPDFKVLAATFVKTQVKWPVTPCRLVHSFGAAQCLHLSSRLLGLPGRICYVLLTSRHGFTSQKTRNFSVDITAFTICPSHTQNRKPELTTWPIRIAVVISHYDVTSTAPALLLLAHTCAEVTAGATSAVVTLPSLRIGPARCHDDRGLQPPWGHAGHKGQLVGVTVQSIAPCRRTRGQLQDGDA